MPKRVTAFELMLSPRDPKTPAYRWIYGTLRTEILEGRLRPGSRLPSSRGLALQYRLSRGTIITAFEQLKSEGYIEGMIGSESYVTKVVPEQLLQVTSARRQLQNPGYVGASCVFEAIGAKVVPAPVDDEGIVLDNRSVRGARLIYVTPGHQFPLGIAMSLARRLHLLELAEKSDALIFEDDYDSEYRYSGRPMPALQGLDRAGRVVYAGTFSKTLFPSIRLGYMVVPTDLISVFRSAKAVTNRHAPVLDQAVLCGFISEGHLGRHLRRMREVYSERLSIFTKIAPCPSASTSSPFLVFRSIAECGQGENNDGKCQAVHPEKLPAPDLQPAR